MVLASVFGWPQKSAKSKLRFILRPTECGLITDVYDDFAFVVRVAMDKVAMFGDQFEFKSECFCPLRIV